MIRQQTLHVAAQVGAGFLLAAIFVSVGLLFLLGFHEHVTAWGAALLASGMAFAAGFVFAIRASPRG